MGAPTSKEMLFFRNFSLMSAGKLACDPFLEVLLRFGDFLKVVFEPLFVSFELFTDSLFSKNINWLFLLNLR